MEHFESLLVDFISWGIMIIELIGVSVLYSAVLQALLAIFRKLPKVRLKLAEGIALALEFKMGSELLRTVIARDISELIVLGVVILLRSALAFLIQWEISIERKTAAP